MLVKRLRNRFYNRAYDRVFYKQEKRINKSMKNK